MISTVKSQLYSYEGLVSFIAQLTPCETKAFDSLIFYSNIFGNDTAPGHRRMARESGHSVKTNQRAIKRFERFSFFGIKRKKYHTNVYTIADLLRNPVIRLKLASRFPQLTNLRNINVYLGDLIEFSSCNVPLLEYANEYDTYKYREDSIISQKREEFSSKSVNAVGERPPATYNAYPYSVRMNQQASELQHSFFKKIMVWCGCPSKAFHEDMVIIRKANFIRHGLQDSLAYKALNAEYHG